MTSVDPTSVTKTSSAAASTGTSPLVLGGTAPGSLPPANFELYVGYDLGGGGNSNQIGSALPAGLPDANGVCHRPRFNDAISHSDTYSSVGIDRAGLIQSEPVNSVTFTSESFTAASPLVTGLTVEHRAAERSCVRYLDCAVNESDAQSGGPLAAIAGSLGTPSPAALLDKYDPKGTPGSKAPVSLSASRQR